MEANKRSSLCHVDLLVSNFDEFHYVHAFRKGKKTDSQSERRINRLSERRTDFRSDNVTA